MKQILVLSIAIFTLTISSCKKDSPANTNVIDIRDKYLGNYDVTENVKIISDRKYNENNSFVGTIEKYEVEESDALFLYFNQATRDRPWSTETAKKFTVFRLDGDSLYIDIQEGLNDDGKIYGYNDSIIINFWFGHGAVVYDVTQKWIKQ